MLEMKDNGTIGYGTPPANNPFDYLNGEWATSQDFQRNTIRTVGAAAAAVWESTPSVTVLLRIGQPIRGQHRDRALRQDRHQPSEPGGNGGPSPAITIPASVLDRWDGPAVINSGDTIPRNALEGSAAAQGRPSCDEGHQARRNGATCSWWLKSSTCSTMRISAATTSSLSPTSAGDHGAVRHAGPEHRHGLRLAPGAVGIQSPVLVARTIVIGDGLRPSPTFVVAHPAHPACPAHPAHPACGPVNVIAFRLSNLTSSGRFRWRCAGVFFLLSCSHPVSPAGFARRRLMRSPRSSSATSVRSATASSRSPVCLATSTFTTPAPHRAASSRPPTAAPTGPRSSTTSRSRRSARWLSRHPTRTSCGPAPARRSSAATSRSATASIVRPTPAGPGRAWPRGDRPHRPRRHRSAGSGRRSRVRARTRLRAAAGAWRVPHC